MADILSEITVPDLGSALSDLKEKHVLDNPSDSGHTSCPLSLAPCPSDNLFAERKRKGWDKSVEARCDFSRKIRITRRSSIFFISLWQKSLFGRTLTDIKGDDSMVDFFADELAPLIIDILGAQLASGDWCIITTPKRRHTTKNFATRISEKLAAILNIPFYEDVCSCHTKQRMDAVFTVNIIPKEQNIICFDDFVTTGQTLHSMKVALEPHRKNIIFFAGINNKL